MCNPFQNRTPRADNNQMPDNSQQSVRLEFPESGVAHVVLDQIGKSANVLSCQFQEEIAVALETIERTPGIDVVVLSSAKPKIFVAGADLNAIVDTLDWSDAEIVAFCDFGQRLYHRFQQGTWTSIAAIHGACVGGGFELALGCDFRVASEDRRTLFGLPETKLGLIPGWAATIRLPRMMELDQAIDLITSGVLFPASGAREFGLIDEIVPADHLIESAIRFARDDKQRSIVNQRRTRQLGQALTSITNADELCRNWSERVRESTEINPFAAEVLAHHMIRSAGMDFHAACESEARAMAIVYGSPQSHGLLNNFFLNEHNRRSPGWQLGDDPPIPVKSIGIAGCGLMGRAIANLAAAKMLQVTVFDVNPEMSKATVAGRENENIRAATNIQELGKCDLIIEAVTERIAEKSAVLTELSGCLKSLAILATNTSTIPIDELARSVTHPDRFCGIHFCHPEILELVEIVIGASTSAVTANTALAWTRQLGKSAVVARDAPGFVVNRLLMGMIDAAIGLLSTNVTWREIDLAMREFGMLGGPFEIVDSIGIDTVVNGGRAMNVAGVHGRSQLPALPRMVRHRRLGRKTGEGFYRYDNGSQRGEFDPAVVELLDDCLKHGGTGKQNPVSIQEKICLSAFIAAAAVLDSGIVADPRDIDLCIIRGLGFPASVGGILFWADRRGPAEIQRMLDQNFGEPAGSLPKSLQNWLHSDLYFYPHGSASTRTGKGVQVTGE